MSRTNWLICSVMIRGGDRSCVYGCRNGYMNTSAHVHLSIHSAMSCHMPHTTYHKPYATPYATSHMPRVTSHLISFPLASRLSLLCSSVRTGGARTSLSACFCNNSKKRVRADSLKLTEHTKSTPQQQPHHTTPHNTTHEYTTHNKHHV